MGYTKKVIKGISWVSALRISHMKDKVITKISSNFHIYKKDIHEKGTYWSVIHRLYKIPYMRIFLTPFVNILKPNYLIIQNQKLYIDKWDDIVSQELILSGVWEEYETELIKENLREGDVILDVGAHIGYYSLIAASIVGEKGKVYAFEPEPRNYKLLEKNIRENGYKNVVLINKAVTDKKKRISLFINDKNTGDHRIYDSGDRRKKIPIDAISLDEYFGGKDRKLNLIKLDIQGAEFFALKGARRLLRDSKNIKIITEFWPRGLELCGSSGEEYLKLLEENKFRLFNINEAKKSAKLITPRELLKMFPPEEEGYTNLLCRR